MEIEVTVCDVCKVVGLETKRFTLIEGRRQVSRDLCEGDAAPVEALMGAKTLTEVFRPHVVQPTRAPQEPPAARTAPTKPTVKQATKKAVRPRKRGSKVTTLGAIEKSKRT